MQDNDYDVIIIGAGGAGLAAAIMAAEAGARVLLVDADGKTGGSTALSGGVFYAAGSSLQAKAGVTDSAEEMYRYYLHINQYKLDPALVRRLCFDAAPVFEWLVGLGVDFPLENLYCSGVDKIRRGHRARGHGAEIAEALAARVSALGIDIALQTRVSQLRMDGDRVAGIVVDNIAVSAGAVVISTGGFGANPQMLAELYPTAAAEGDRAWYIGTPYAQGDGITMARAVGAGVTRPDRGLLLLTPNFAKELETYLPPWLMHVTREGRRFVDESCEYSVLAELLREQTGGECFAIFDEDARQAATAVPAPNWSADRLAHFVRNGPILRADTLPALALMAGIDPDTLVTSAAQMSADAAHGADGRFFKDTRHLRPIATPPFHAVKIRPSIVCWTGTGLRIDPETQVLGGGDRPIRGLFAAGEATGGMFGPCYAGGGASLGNAVIFGRIAGLNAAKAALS